MQEADEQDTCRICSAPAEPDQPLFHPCKCSGTIRYIHQDCLTTWLAHSKKKTCDVCKHPYAFTKVYASDMPSSLPLHLLIRRLVQQLFLGIIFVIRAIVVAAIWLGVLPWVTVWTWRMYFAMGDSAAWWISNRPRPIIVEPDDQNIFEPPVPPPNTLLGRITSHPLWTALSSDIFTGQIIASLIVLTFVAIFLLREWISQNARPGVFEDEEPLPEIPLPPPPQPPQQGPQAQLQAQAPMQLPRVEQRPFVLRRGNENDERLIQRQVEALRAIEALRNAGGVRPAAGPPPRWDDEEAIQRVLDAVGRGRRLAEQAKAAAEAEGAKIDDDDEDAKRRWSLKTEEDVRKVKMLRRKMLKRKLAHEHQKIIASNRGESSRSSMPTTPHTAEDTSVSPLVSSSSPIPAIPFPLRAPASRPTSATSSPGPYPPRPPMPNTFTDGLPSPATTRALASPSLATYRAPEEFGTPEAGPSSYFPDDSSFGSLVTQRSGTPVFVEDEEDEEGGFEIGHFPDDPEEMPRRLFLEPQDEDDEYDINDFPNFPDDEEGKAIAEDEDEDVPSTPLQERLQAAKEAKSANAQGDEGSDLDIDMEAETKRFFREQRDKKVLLTFTSRRDGEGQAQAASGPSTGHSIGLLNDLGAATDTSDDSGESVEGNKRDAIRAPVPAVPEAGAAAPDLARRERQRVWQPVRIEMDDEGDLFRDGDEDEQEEDEAREDEFDVQWVDEDEEDGEADEGIMMRPRQQPPVVPAPPPVGAAPPPPDVPDLNRDAEMAAALEANEDLEGAEDDMEGAMEAVGLRGPVFGVIQNAALMIFVLDTAIGIGVWIPYTIGKTAALLSLDPRRTLEVLHFPIRAIRLVTDPIVDLVAFIFTGIIWLFMAFARMSFLGDSWIDRVSDAAEKAYTASIDILKPVADFAFPQTSSNTDQAVWNITADLEESLSSIPDYLGFTEPYFEALGKEVRVTTVNAQATWIQLALGNGPSNRVFAVALGYVVVAFILALYLNILTVGNARTAGRAVRSAVRQQLLVLKVATFIFIELVTFPLACGMILDLCTIWLFPQASIQSRLSSILHAPLTAMFYHWMAGTTFMYGFAMLLAGARTVIRPGAMWFIKDPADQNTHPIREILDRPTLVQLRKIMLSGLMYAVVVACIVASLGGLLLLGRKSVLPFRWKNRQPLSKVPVDLLFLHLVLPYTMHYFRPKRATRTFVLFVWKFLSRQLRLSSYFFGGRYPSEERSAKTWKEFFYGTPVETFKTTKAVESKKVEGGFRRVPATDNIALPREIRATVAVNEDGEPVDDAARELMEIQNAEAEKAAHQVKDDYMIVYTPPHFKYRVILFILLLWSIGALIAGLGIALPILLGRRVFRLWTPEDVHDGYSLILGVYLVWACYLVAQAVDRLDKRRQRRSSGSDGPRAHLYVLVLKRGLPWLAKTAYMVFWLGIVIPVLIAMVVDLYMILPIRLTLNPEMVPRMRVVDLWALGLLYSKLGLHLHRVQPPNRISRGLRHILARGWTRPSVVMATKEFIAPLVGGLLGMILFPGAVFRAIQWMFPNLPVDNRFIFNHVYPAVFVAAGSARSTMALYGVLMSWSQSIRDKEFLVEMRLKNHEPEVPTPKEGDGDKAKEGEQKEKEGDTKATLEKGKQREVAATEPEDKTAEQPAETDTETETDARPHAALLAAAAEARRDKGKGKAVDVDVDGEGESHEDWAALAPIFQRPPPPPMQRSPSPPPGPRTIFFGERRVVEWGLVTPAKNLVERVEVQPGLEADVVVDSAEVDSERGTSPPSDVVGDHNHNHSEKGKGKEREWA